MSIIERIKSIFKRQNQLLLEEDKTKTLEEGIASYLENLLELSSKKDANDLSYYALLQVNSHSTENKGKNDKNEEKFIKKIRRKYNKYRIMTQPRSLDKPVHQYIIYDKKFDIDTLDKNSTRMYINLKRENITEFAQEFIKQVGEHSFYIKFRSDLGAQNRRSDPFIIYLKNEDKEYFTNVIKQISNKKPHIMEGTNQRNPFLAKGSNNSISEVPQSENGVIILNDNRAMSVTKSYNTMVSYLLEDSFRNTLQEQIGDSINVKEIGLVGLLEVFEDKIKSKDVFKMKMTSKVLQLLGKNKMPIPTKDCKSDISDRSSLLENLHISTNNIEKIKENRKNETKPQEQREEI